MLVDKKKAITEYRDAVLRMLRNVFPPATDAQFHDAVNDVFRTRKTLAELGIELSDIENIPDLWIPGATI